MADEADKAVARWQSARRVLLAHQLKFEDKGKVREVVPDPEHHALWQALAAAETALAALPIPSGAEASSPQWRATHRHYKGGLYRVLCEADREYDLCPMIVYEGEHGDRWIRSKAEFEDTLNTGVRRFEPLSSAPPTPPAEVGE